MINMTTEEFHTALYALVDSSHTVIINDGTTDGISLINGKINVHNIKITSERFYMDDGTNKLLALRYADLTGVDVSSVTDLHQCFTDVHYGMKADIVISNWDTSSVTNMSQMFYAYRGTSLDTRGLDTQNVTDMSGMFEKCYANIINLSTFDTSSVTNDTDMFLDCTTTRIVVNKDKWTLDTSSGVFYNYNGKVYIGDTEIMTKANSDRDIATSLNSALANYHIGMIIAFAGSTAPNGWFVCDGREVSRTEYSRLFALIGITYGNGDGTTTFNIPNLQDRFLQGASTTNVVGTSKEAGLPNIKGTFGIDDLASKYTNCNSGALSRGANIGVSDTRYSSAIGGYMAMNFNASLSNAIYGNSSTVQPPSICINYIIKY